ncbi:hypothetical protein MRB53_040117 [Persea americana]|nr:hypothetical protein MRB53_040117 [Persea americana]
MTACLDHHWTSRRSKRTASNSKGCHGMIAAMHMQNAISGANCFAQTLWTCRPSQTSLHRLWLQLQHARLPNLQKADSGICRSRYSSSCPPGLTFERLPGKREGMCIDADDEALARRHLSQQPYHDTSSVCRVCYLLGCCASTPTSLSCIPVNETCVRCDTAPRH